MRTTAHLKIGSTNKLELIGFQDTTDLSYPQDATVTAELFDPTGTAVPAASGANKISMPYVATTTGPTTTYRGILSSTISGALTPGTYELKYTAIKGANRAIFSVICPATEG